MIGADTKILMVNGILKCAKDICIGDWVVRKDGVIEKITDIFKGIDDILEIITQTGERLWCNQNHPILTECGIKRAKDINDSIRILCADGSLTKVEMIFHIEKDLVYGFTYQGDDNTIITNGLCTGNMFLENSIYESNSVLSEEKLSFIDEMRSYLKNPFSDI